jgi:TPP-dependent pyruvate/acetoin dehydrogenase alpha subunit
MPPNRATLITLYRDLVRVRKLEEAHILSVAEGKIPGFVHSGIGQEAVGVGVCAHLRADDYMLPTHRGFSHVVTKGVPPRELLAETYGRRTGIARGKGGIHFAYWDLKVAGISGTVGGAFPLAAGLAIAAQHDGRGQIVACFFGDGAAQRGTLHEAMNLATLWRLPVLWVCENNQFGLSMPASRGLVGGDVAHLAPAYDLPCEVVDGNDLLAVYAAAGEAVARVRAGEGPRLLELKVYRWRGHYEGEPARYRPREEPESWINEHDPVQIFRADLLTSGFSPADLDALDVEAQAEIDEAMRFADESPWPEPAEALEDVYAAG